MMINKTNKTIIFLKKLLYENINDIYLFSYIKLLLKSKVNFIDLNSKEFKHYEGLEFHHGIPKCLGGSNSLDNLFVLSIEDHALAHRFLYLSSAINSNLSDDLKKKIKSSYFIRFFKIENDKNKITFANQQFKKIKVYCVDDSEFLEFPSLKSFSSFIGISGCRNIDRFPTIFSKKMDKLFIGFPFDTENNIIREVISSYEKENPRVKIRSEISLLVRNKNLKKINIDDRIKEWIYKHHKTNQNAKILFNFISIKNNSSEYYENLMKDICNKKEYFKAKIGEDKKLYNYVVSHRNTNKFANEIYENIKRIDIENLAVEIGRSKDISKLETSSHKKSILQWSKNNQKNSEYAKWIMENYKLNRRTFKDLEKLGTEILNTGNIMLFYQDVSFQRWVYSNKDQNNVAKEVFDISSRSRRNDEILKTICDKKSFNEVKYSKNPQLYSYIYRNKENNEYAREIWTNIKKEEKKKVFCFDEKNHVIFEFLSIELCSLTLKIPVSSIRSSIRSSSLYKKSFKFSYNNDFIDHSENLNIYVIQEINDFEKIKTEL